MKLLVAKAWEKTPIQQDMIYVVASTTSVCLLMTVLHLIQIHVIYGCMKFFEVKLQMAQLRIEYGQIEEDQKNSPINSLQNTNDFKLVQILLLLTVYSPISKEAMNYENSYQTGFSPNTQRKNYYSGSCSTGVQRWADPSSGCNMSLYDSSGKRKQPYVGCSCGEENCLFLNNPTPNSNNSHSYISRGTMPAAINANTAYPPLLNGSVKSGHNIKSKPKSVSIKKTVQRANCYHDINSRSFYCCCGSVHVVLGAKLFLVFYIGLTAMGIWYGAKSTIVWTSIPIFVISSSIYGFIKQRHKYIYPFLIISVVQIIACLIMVIVVVGFAIFNYGTLKNIAASNNFYEMDKNEISETFLVVTVGILVGLCCTMALIHVWQCMVVYKCLEFFEVLYNGKIVDNYHNNTIGPISNEVTKYYHDSDSIPLYLTQK
uniref:Transmembrane protein n=1 Tax=Rhabditophanes sp. KR3021 TaxID=114890 RepID=A0AC35U5I0_9BILA